MSSVNNNLLYGISDKPRTIKEWFLYALQQLLAVFVATVLIANICGTPISSCFLGGAIGTLVYQLITRFKSPMFISNSGQVWNLPLRFCHKDFGFFWFLGVRHVSVVFFCVSLFMIIINDKIYEYGYEKIIFCFSFLLHQCVCR